MNHLLSAVSIEVERCKGLDSLCALAVRGAIRNLARNLHLEGDISSADYDAVVIALESAYPENVK